jgi:microcompartment protein CcmL/EutN
MGDSKGRSTKKKAVRSSLEKVSPPFPKAGPALGLLELTSVARGMVVADAVVKKAAVNLLRSAPVSPGKFVVILTGGEEEVAESMKIGTELASATLIDRLYLPHIDEQIAPVMRGAVQQLAVSAVGIVETYSVASAILAADKSVKRAEVQLIQMRLARGLGGKAFFTMTGELAQLEAAIEGAREILHDGMLLTTEVIARPHPDFVETLLREGYP